MDLLVGSWNDRSLVKCSGDAHICRCQPLSSFANEGVDHKLYLLVKWLKGYQVCAAGIYSRN